MTDFADYWDADEQRQKQRPLTADEQAELTERRRVAALPVVPESVPKLNARLVLIGAGYWDDVVAFTALRGPVAVAFLEDALTMRRDNPLVNAWATARGKTAELDSLFIAAEALKIDEFTG